jgi:hypothetical protein
MSTSRHPMELVDRYLQAVRFWLPKTERQDDILAEFGEDLRSQIDEKQAEMGRPLQEDEVAAILKACGAPMVVATRLGPQRSLIGPAVYPIYTFVMKMVLLWVLIPVFLFIVGPANLSSADGWATAVTATLGDLVYGWFMAAGIITLVFALVERTHAHAAIACKWDPRTLPPLQAPDRKTSVVRSLCDMAFAYFGLVWLLLLPHRPFLILGPAATFLKAAPALHVFYLPIVVLSALALLRSTTIVMRPQWTRFPLRSLFAHEVLTFILLTLMLNAAGALHAADWHPFVVLTESARNSVQYAKVPLIVNLSILISVLIWWFSLGIALIVHAWQLIDLGRGKRAQPQSPASLRAR